MKLNNICKVIIQIIIILCFSIGYSQTLKDLMDDDKLNREDFYQYGDEKFEEYNTFVPDENKNEKIKLKPNNNIYYQSNEVPSLNELSKQRKKLGDIADKYKDESERKSKSWKEIDSYYDKDTQTSNLNKYDPVKPFRYEYDIEEAFKNIKVITDSDGTLLPSGSMAGTDNKGNIIINKEVLKDLLKQVNNQGASYALTQCSKRIKTFNVDMTNLATGLMQGLGEGMADPNLGVDAVTDMLNNTGSSDSSDSGNNSNSGISQEEINNTVQRILNQSGVLDLFNNAMNSNTSSSNNFISQDVRTQGINAVGEEANRLIEQQLADAFGTIGAQDLTPEELQTFYNQTYLQTINELREQMSNEDDDDDDSNEMLNQILDFLMSLLNMKTFDNFYDNSACFETAKRFVKGSKARNINIWRGSWCPCGQCFGPGGCFTIIAQTDIWTYGMKQSEVSSTLVDCMKSSQDVMKSDSLVNCIEEEKSNYVNNAMNMISNSIQKVMSVEDEGIEFTKVDKELNRKSLNYLLYGSASGRQFGQSPNGTDESNGKKQYNPKEIHTDDFEKIATLSNKTNKEEKSIYLPSGMKITLTNKAMEYQKLDDFMPLEDRQNIKNNVKDSFKNNKQDYLVQNSLMSVTYKLDEYDKRLKQLNDFTNEYMEEFIIPIIFGDNNKVNSLNKIAENCIIVMQSIAGEVGKLKNNFLKYIANKSSASTSDTSNDTMELFGIVTVDSNYYDDYEYNKAIMKIMNDTAFFVCNDYYTKYKFHLSNSVNNVSGFAFAGDYSKEKGNDPNVSGYMFNEEIQKIITRNLEKLESQVDLIDSYNKSLKDYYKQNNELINASLEDFTY
jgi:hypothetical protein